jgi:hypothetical protein
LITIFMAADAAEQTRAKAKQQEARKWNAAAANKQRLTCCWNSMPKSIVSLAMILLARANLGELDEGQP